MSHPPGWEEPNAGVISPRALRAAPGKVRSPRTGRMVAQSTALAEYRQSLDSVPVRSEAMHGGLWSHEQEAAMGPRKGPPRPQRGDAETFACFFAARGGSLSTKEWELYQLFWIQRLSYAEVARARGDITREGVYRAICRLRVKCRQWVSR